MHIFYHIPILQNYPIQHIWGDINDYFILLARSGSISYTLTMDEIKNGNWLYSRLLDPGQAEQLYLFSDMKNGPMPERFPADLVYFHSQNAVCISRPIPSDVKINSWADQIHKYEPVDHFIVACIMITLLVNRNKNILKNVILSGDNPHNYFSNKVAHLKFCLEQNRRIEEFSV